MTAVTPTYAQGQLADALTMVRMSRHHPGCRCCLYRRFIRLAGIEVKGAGYCSIDEWTWSETVDRILTTILRQSF